LKIEAPVKFVFDVIYARLLARPTKLNTEQRDVVGGRRQEVLQSRAK
jgi:hypothetical protein